MFEEDVNFTEEEIVEMPVIIDAPENQERSEEDGGNNHKIRILQNIIIPIESNHTIENIVSEANKN